MRAILFGLCAFGSTMAFSQSNVTSGGGDENGSGGSVSYSVGQIDYAHVDGANNSWNEGVQQPFEFYQVSGFEENDLNVSIFPNPTEGKLVIRISNDNLNTLFKVYDAAGKLILTDRLIASETIIDLESYATGVYSIQIGTNEQFNTYKLVKN